MKKALLSFPLLLCFISLWGQEYTQTVRGSVVDQESKFPLIGVTVQIFTDTGLSMGTTTDLDGRFRIEAVPVGRQTIEFSYVGYESTILSNVVVSTGKEVVMEVELEESIMDLGEVVVIGQRSGEVRNEMAVISARQFSVEETDRYAGSRGDPGRMASNFAGVQGADDSRNDIIVRGNSPAGVLWRLENVNIPNPNHFALAGTSGGPVTILNNKYLDDSDFFTGAFPAEFGNTISAVFDLRMRNGNNEKHEFSAQLGFIGTELTAEGPINKEKQSSYLAAYRYSTFQLFSFLGIDLGTDAVPRYQDAAFRLNFPTQNGGNLAFWGIGGMSGIGIVLSTEVSPSAETNLFGSNDRDQYFDTQTGVTGLTLTQPLNRNTYIKATVSASIANSITHHEQIFRQVVNEQYVLDSLPAILDYQFKETKFSGNFFVNHKFSKRTTIKAGINADWWQMRYLDSVRLVVTEGATGQPVGLSDWTVRWDGDQGAPMLQPYVQVKHKMGEKWTVVAGLTSLYWGLNDISFSPLEPRLGATYQVAPKAKLNLGYGMHSQTLPGYLYFYGIETQGRDPQEHNFDLGLTKSQHVVLGYDWNPGRFFRIKSEVYYQYLYDIPVEVNPSSFSLVNTGSGFSRFFPDTLQNTGTGRNFGLELTLERFFAGGYYFLVTGSVFDSKYRGSDGVLRNTTFNGRFAANAVFAKEFAFKRGSSLNIGGKLTYIGGRWYGPVDLEESARLVEIIWEDEGLNTLQFDPYFRADVRVAFRLNRERLSHEFAIDFVNATNRQNILTLTFAPNHPSGNPIQEEYQLGFLPIFYYKVEF